MRFIATLAATCAAVVMSGQSWAQDAAAGEKVFAKCKACHVADKDTNKIGPSLKGLFGRTAGTHAEFKYSPAMVDAGKAGLVWDDAKLTEYLHNPKAKVKGTKMAFAGLKKDDEIANLIAYLKRSPECAARPEEESTRHLTRPPVAAVPPEGRPGCRAQGRRQAHPPVSAYNRHGSVRPAFRQPGQRRHRQCCRRPSALPTGAAPSFSSARNRASGAGFLATTASPPTTALKSSIRPKCTRISRVAACGLLVTTPRRHAAHMQDRQRFAHTRHQSRQFGDMAQIDRRHVAVSLLQCRAESAVSRPPRRRARQVFPHRCLSSASRPARSAQAVCVSTTIHSLRP